ncbi:CDP-diacylglycerol--glycerol-3-phosphate 3-phosphatidyltransferase [Ereboglobus luteus]|uniref:CDP-diacylglycerol--glycerol-3-phosphate 3-phosphatidyltransferase n=1 Tax=Ereboglobus luteus TaxID=1796921 RepID=A0A2U8DZ36_9BACT|nr:CDP-diacylglycerol--glycerol-3-phosphate 3-phosphatidyltransferase [Ereboglobus luteus]AWI07893.1 CDP-diacylglycerol--glycerol-3-phosphate 3-phosphatidyltransferase [Ereboglobus luteus]
MKLNLPNIITLSRIPLMFVIIWLMFCSWRGSATIAFVLFIISAISDWFDGYLARKQNIVTNFGKFMDALTDKILVIGIMVALVAYYGIKQGSDRSHLVIFFLVLVMLTLCREFLVSGMRMVAASKGVVVAAERTGKIKTIVQLIAVAFMLLEPAIAIDWAHRMPVDISIYSDIINYTGLGLFVLATLLTVSSGVSYILKYRKVFEEGALKG